jgi:hypothetical protein
MDGTSAIANLGQRIVEGPFQFSLLVTFILRQLAPSVSPRRCHLNCVDLGKKKVKKGP